MITIEDIRDYIESLDFGANKYAIGTIDGEEQKVIACFETIRKDKTMAPQGTHFNKTIELYIHWTTDYRETDRKGLEIYESLFRRHSFEINGQQVSFLIVEPIQDEHKDQYGIYNRSITIQFIQ
jgi:hypothetical protein